ncbi:MAG: glycosyltransferase [Streptomycetaceae bacterium]|nr:MAG: glycosyltransferase [Streptomycetaceae bacterium]
MLISLISSADQVSDARMHRLCGALVRSGCEVEVWALGSHKDAPAGVIFHRAPGGKGFAARVLRDLVLPFKAKGEIWIVVAPDLLPMSWLFARIKGRKLVADVHENYFELLKDRAWAKGLIGELAKVIARVATKVAAHADLTTVADVQVPPFKAYNRLVVRNFPDLSLLTLSGELSPEARAIYIGDVRSSRGIKMLLHAAELSPLWSFDIVGNVSANDAEFIDNWKTTNIASARVTFHGRLTPSASWSFAKGAWVGLSLLELTPAFSAAVPSKLYEYMASGLATISTPLPRCIELIEKSNSGVIAKDAAEVAVTLNAWATNSSALIAMRKNAVAWATSNLNSAAEYEAFVSAIKALIPSSR